MVTRRYGVQLFFYYRYLFQSNSIKKLRTLNHAVDILDARVDALDTRLVRLLSSGTKLSSITTL
jgi:hypothetical protein